MNYSELKTIKDLNVDNKVVFLRLDLNIPIVDGKITSYKRINETLDTINYLIDNKAKIVILSHFGRPSTLENISSQKFSLKQAAEALFKKISNNQGKRIFLSVNKGDEIKKAILQLNSGDIIVLENTRFNDVDSKTGEKINYESNNNEQLAKEWASLCDVFINDAFGAAHRKHASNYGIGQYAKDSAIGFLMQRELQKLGEIISDSKKPFVVIFGGAKVSDKLKAVNAVIQKADKVIISGGMAYTFVKAQGFDVGKSMVEDSMLDTARDLMKKYGDKLCISEDFMCSPTFSDTEPVYRTQQEGLGQYMGLDIGPKTIEKFKKIISTANTILWNGPMGVTEFSHYEKGTIEVCNAIAKRTEAGAFTVIGGGDSAAAAEKLGKEKSFTFISTGGGASLRFIEGTELDGLKSIQRKNK